MGKVQGLYRNIFNYFCIYLVNEHLKSLVMVAYNFSKNNFTFNLKQCIIEICREGP